MWLASFATVSLIFVTWAMTRVSVWIVGHDPVWAQMDREGAGLEHALAEAFLQAGVDGFIYIVEGICGIAFLWLLWHTLYRDEHRDAAS